MAIVFAFPGQGSQVVGMGKALAEAYAESRSVFEEVDDALGEALSKTIFEGPEDALTLTRNAQPALMAVSMAALRALEKYGISVREHADYVAGHSLGEYSALAAAGSLSIGDSARLLRIRGEAMQQAVPVGEGAMAAILGLDVETVREVADKASQGDTCEAANDNAPGQVVVSGAKRAVERAVDVAKARGAKRAMLLPVSAPFHCSLMRPAAERMADALAAVEIEAPAVPLIANVTASPISEVAQIRRRLVEQVTGMVRWRESVEWMAGNDVGTMAEIGAGRVLSGLVRRIAPQMTTLAVGTPEEVVKAAEAIAAAKQ
ncbi:ACP S-malonyltransferase [Afifella pfennigii]|uniref:ACP S-malonyltransferase n=1 Tax=Afifella pfennigii TaxID=209897 RepID=UPI00047EE4A9|nr:ACP S-malonyltransferase [Afifella pfennigii]